MIHKNVAPVLHTPMVVNPINNDRNFVDQGLWQIYLSFSVPVHPVVQGFWTRFQTPLRWNFSWNRTSLPPCIAFGRTSKYIRKQTPRTAEWYRSSRRTVLFPAFVWYPNACYKPERFVHVTWIFINSTHGLNPLVRDSGNDTKLRNIKF